MKFWMFIKSTVTEAVCFGLVTCFLYLLSTLFFTPIVLNICSDLDTDLPALPGPAAPRKLCWMLFPGADKLNLMCPSSGSAPTLSSRADLLYCEFACIHAFALTLCN